MEGLLTLLSGSQGGHGESAVHDGSLCRTVNEACGQEGTSKNGYGRATGATIELPLRGDLE